MNKSFATLLFPYVFKDVGYALALSALFFLMLFIARRKRTLPSIDIVGRKTGGSYLLALGIGATYYISVVFDNNMLFTLPILIFAICDPLACIVGKKIKSKRIHNGKTTIGSFFFFLSSLVISLCYLTAVRYESVVMLSLMIALTTTLAEMLSTRGTDNLTIPLSAAGMMILFHRYRRLERTI